MPKLTKLPRKRVKILDVYVDSTSMEALLKVIGQKLGSGHKFYIVTPNPEIILEACKDKLLAKIINEADISLPDGIGLKLASPDLNIVHGRKLFLELCNLAQDKELKVFLLGGGLRPGTAGAAASKLKKVFPSLKIEHADGPKLNKNGQPDTELDSKVNNDIVKKINSFNPDLVFVGFGVSKQEKWIYRNKSKLNVKGLMVVGGVFDVLAGNIEAPPAFMEKLELEWLWRLFVEPKRLVRIIKAVIVFPLRLILS